MQRMRKSKNEKTSNIINKTISSGKRNPEYQMRRIKNSQEDIDGLT